MFEILAAYLKENAGLTDEELKPVENVFTVKKLRKRQYLLHEGMISRYNCFIAKGCLRLYRISNDGAEHILRFGIENWWISDYDSYNTGKPAKGNIDALEDSNLLLIEKENFDALCKDIPKLRLLKEKLQAKNFEINENRILSNISETAEERLTKFIKCYSQFYNRIPLHMIASFLGVSRETLSRIRHQHARESIQ